MSWLCKGGIRCHRGRQLLPRNECAACQLCPRHQYHTTPSFSWNQSPVSASSSQPSFSRLFPTDTRAAQFWRAGTVAKARWREKALKNHFMKHPCSRRPSHKAQAADFPLATHPTQRRGAQAQPALVLTHWEPQGVRTQQGWHCRALGSKPHLWHLLWLWSA